MKRISPLISIIGVFFVFGSIVYYVHTEQWMNLLKFLIYFSLGAVIGLLEIDKAIGYWWRKLTEKKRTE